MRSPSSDDSAGIERALDAKLSESLRFGAFTTPAVIALTVLGLGFGFGWRAGIAIWAGLMLIVAALQFDTQRRTVDAPGWRQRALLTQLVAGSVWGLLAAFALPEGPAGQALLVAGLLGVVASSVPFASTVRSAALAFVAAMTVVAAISLAVQTTGSIRLLAVVVVVSGAFYAGLSMVVHSTHRETAMLTAELRRAASTDALTGVWNREAFGELLTAHLGGETPLLVAFVDLDGFKAVNDTHGHGVGDEVLAEVARRLTCVGDGEVGRIGGDEFLLLDVDGTDPEEFGRRILDQFTASFDVDGCTHPIGCSVGVAQHDASRNQTGNDPDAVAKRLLKSADTAQYAAKRAGGGCVVAAGCV